MAKLIIPAEKLVKKYNEPMARESVAMASDSMGVGSIKKFLNTGNEFLHISVPVANTAASVIITLTSVAAFDSARTVDLVITVLKGSTCIITNLNPLDMGDIVAISSNLSGSDTMSATIINPSAL